MKNRSILQRPTKKNLVNPIESEVLTRKIYASTDIEYIKETNPLQIFVVGDESRQNAACWLLQ